jgi:FkbM family methyltransferase
MRIRVPRAVGHAYWNPYRDYDYESEEFEAIMLFGKPGWIYVDVGANVGILTLAMSRMAGTQGQVIACEPNPYVYEILLNTLRLNRRANVTPLQTLLMDRPAAVPFNISPYGGLGVRSSVAYHDPGSRKIVLPSTTIDLLSEGLERLDFLKIDAEGAELAILKGSLAAIRKYQPLIQVKVHGQYLPHLGGSAEQVFEWMAEQGYVSFNPTTRALVTAKEFSQCTHCHVPDDFTKKDVAYQGYGQVLFVPQSRSKLLSAIAPRPCTAC